MQPWEIQSSKFQNVLDWDLELKKYLQKSSVNMKEIHTSDHDNLVFEVGVFHFSKLVIQLSVTQQDYLK